MLSGWCSDSFSRGASAEDGGVLTTTVAIEALCTIVAGVALADRARPALQEPGSSDRCLAYPPPELGTNRATGLRSRPVSRRKAVGVSAAVPDPIGPREGGADAARSTVELDREMEREASFPDDFSERSEQGVTARISLGFGSVGGAAAACGRHVGATAAGGGATSGSGSGFRPRRVLELSVLTCGPA